MQIRQFCTSFASSAAFACCAPGDKNEPAFAARYRFVNSAQCASFLSSQESSSAGRQAFDAAAAQSCLAHLSSRQCGVAVTKAVLREEQVAGCYRLLTGKATEGQGCTTSDDCALGLVCPPVRETGAALERISQVAEQSAQLVDGISRSSNDQVLAAQELVRAMQRISDVSHLTLERSTRSRESIRGLAQWCERLAPLIPTEPKSATAPHLGDPGDAAACPPSWRKRPSTSGVRT